MYVSLKDLWIVNKNKLKLKILENLGKTNTLLGE